MDICDLHMHSTASDGTVDPENLVAMAQSLGLRAAALTDHNTVAGLPVFRKAAENAGLEVSCGIEITTSYKGEEIHLLGHFLRRDCWKEMEQFTAKRNVIKEQSNRACIERMAADGYDVTYGEMNAMFPDMTHNRVHIANLLVKKGLVQDVAEGFAKFLSPEGPYYREAEKLPFAECAAKILQCGGVPIVAHPLLNVERQEMPAFIEYFKACGVAGMETRYTLFDEDDTAFLTDLAEQYHLLQSGGSDFHGLNKKGIQMGVGHGNLSVPYEYFLRIRDLAMQARTEG